jgi:hypothetical protein
MHPFGCQYFALSKMIQIECIADFLFEALHENDSAAAGQDAANLDAMRWMLII